MRVVIVCPWPPWRTTDGVVLLLHHHLQHLAERHDITVLAAGASRAEDAVPEAEESKLPAGVHLRWFGTEQPAALDYAMRRVRSELTGEPAHTFFTERAPLLAALRAEAVTADLVHLVGWGTAQLAMRIAPTPAVHVAVDPWAANLGNRRLAGWRRLTDLGQRAKVAAHERRHYPHAHTVVLVSADDVQLMQSTIPAAHFVAVPNGVTAGPVAVPIPTAPVLGFHGAFEAQHNVDAARALVERILPIVRREVPEARVLLVGRDPTPDVRRLADREGVELRASVPDVRRELDRMAVYVAWMTSGFGIKNKVLEAMAAGRPVVANAKGASGIGAGDGLFVAQDESAAAAEIVRLVRSSAAASAAGTANRTRVERDFTWASSAAKVEAIWHEAAGV